MRPCGDFHHQPWPTIEHYPVMWGIILNLTIVRIHMKQPVFMKSKGPRFFFQWLMFGFSWVLSWSSKGFEHRKTIQYVCVCFSFETMGRWTRIDLQGVCFCGSICYWLTTLFYCCLFFGVGRNFSTQRLLSEVNEYCYKIVCPIYVSHCWWKKSG